MQALDALLNRVSVPRLLDPAPSAAQREVLFAAALRAPDHGQLRPWRFLTVEGAAREQMGELLAQAALLNDPQAPEAVLDKARKGPLRAPLVVVVVARLQEHFKVPKAEQLLAAGCAAHGILLAAYAQGIGAVWRTGELCYSPHVAQGLGLAQGEEVIAFLYLGTPQNEPRVAPKVDVAPFVSAWPGRSDT
ncbi:nitroreductase family protein [Pseudomonas sp. Irchel 3E20]|uniref:nitroreductase family protein n=1 Tax=Pseudomonas sp. Irchel 3E20 TaxID=2008983 RepID=UPI000BA3EB42|nr:nitroreductase family protein [Pseudomonas sp. Irchel 3E20]